MESSHPFDSTDSTETSIKDILHAFIWGGRWTGSFDKGSSPRVRVHVPQIIPHEGSLYSLPHPFCSVSSYFSVCFQASVSSGSQTSIVPSVLTLNVESQQGWSPFSRPESISVWSYPVATPPLPLFKDSWRARENISFPPRLSDSRRETSAQRLRLTLFGVPVPVSCSVIFISTLDYVVTVTVILWEIISHVNE